MRDAISDSQWAAGRALVEGEFTTHSRVAACMGIHTTTLSHRASEYGWKTLDYRRPNVRAAQRATVALAAAARAGEEIDPAILLAFAEGDEELDDSSRDAVAAVAGLAGFKGGPLDLAAHAPLEPLPDLPPFERAERLRDMLAGRMEEMLRRAEAGRPVEGRQVAALAALAQLADRIAPPPSPEDAARERAIKSDKELAEVLKRIDERIVCLSQEWAVETLVWTGMQREEAEARVEEVSDPLARHEDWAGGGDIPKRQRVREAARQARDATSSL